MTLWTLKQGFSGFLKDSDGEWYLSSYMHPEFYTQLPIKQLHYHTHVVVSGISQLFSQSGIYFIHKYYQQTTMKNTI